MPIPMKVSIDGGTPINITAAATLVLQGTNSAGKPVRLKRIELQSSNTGASQQVVTISFGFYATGSGAGGSVPVGVPVDEGLTGVYTGSTVFRAGTTTLGTTFTNKKTWQWLTPNPFDIVDGLLELQDEIPVSKVWALLIPTAPTAFLLSGTVHYEEFG
jgi:hypothetical protein